MNLRNLKPILPSLEEHLLLFPVLVTVGLAATYLFGGHLSVWHWWGAVIAMLGFSLARKSWQGSLAFLAFLASLWLLAGISAYIAHVDYPLYHFPGIRLLIHGWNPVEQSTLADLEQMGIALNELRPYHLLFTQKAVWYFSASAYTFTHAPFSLLIPLFAFLFCSAVMQLWRTLRGMHWSVRLLACVCLWHMSLTSDVLVDCAVMFSGIGLLCAMVRALRGDKGVLLPLMVFSFWMMNAKLPGLISCFVFWLCFSVAWLIRSRAALPRLAALGGILTVLFCITSASPYYTAWRDYGHPLYPAMTADETIHPVVDITEDFRMGSEDAFKMGPVGNFVNAYISNTLALTYYRWKYDDPEFTPTRETWKQYNSDPTPTSPTGTKARVKLLLGFLAIFILGRKEFAFLGITCLFGLALFPSEYMGFERYYLWIHFVPLLGLTLVAHYALTYLPKIKPLLIGATCIYLVYAVNSETANKLDFAYARQRYLEEASVPTMTTGMVLEAANLRLLQRDVPALAQAQIVVVDTTYSEAFRSFFNEEFNVPSDAPLEDYSPYLKMKSLPKKERKVARLIFVAKAYGVALPHLIARRLAELF